jgi:large subunit ribosomal protein L15
MQIHNIKREHPNKESRRVGRGGVHGKTSGRGTKGQKARAGHRMRPEMRDIIKKLPKKRGYGKNRARSVVPMNLRPLVLNVGFLEKHFEAGASVTFATLSEKKLVKTQKGKIPTVKILGNGEITKKLVLSGLNVSARAKAKIEKAGGSVSEK